VVSEVVNDASGTPVAARAWEILAGVPDPEIPALSVVDLGIVRDVEECGQHVTVTLTPTYSGCPATEVITADVRAALAVEYADVEVRIQLSPAWTTDWLSGAGREKLLGYGIAPPNGAGAEPNGAGAEPNGAAAGPDGRRTLTILDVGAPAACPQCGSGDVEELAGFGSTPCKALWRCVSCREPFDYFKAH
jgi:ring-1,2-phenylacetyl-CoA epoxidase subunit PaaD